MSLPSGSIAFIIGNFSAIVASHAVVECFFKGRDIYRRWVAGCLSFVLLIQLDLLVLGTLGLLRPSLVAGFMLIMAIICVLMTRLLGRRYALFLNVGEQGLSESGRTDSDLQLMRMLATAMFVLFVVGLILRFAFQSPRWFSDDFAYHATNVVQWILDERLSFGAMNDHAYYPANSELIPLWLILPFRADGMAVWTGLPWLAVGTAAMIGLARSQRLDPSIGVMTIALVAASPGIAWMLRTFSAADFSGPVMLLTSVSFLAPFERENRLLSPPPSSSSSASPTKAERHACSVDVVFAGLAAGFAIGSKIPFVFPTAFLGLWIIFDKEPGLDMKGRLKRASLFGIAIIATGAYWYVHNWIFTGNPVFPGKIWPFDAPLTSANTKATLFQWMTRPPVLSAWKGFAERYLNWPLGLGLLALAAFVAAIVSLVRAPRGGRGSVRLVLCLTFFILLVSHPFMPVSGPVPVDSPNPRFIPRYINSVFVIGMALAAPLLGSTGRARWMWWAWALLSLVTAWPGPGKSVLALTILAIAAVLVVHLRPSHLSFRLPWQRVAVGYAIVVVVVVGLAFYSTRSQRIVDRYVLNEYTMGPELVHNGWRALDRLPPGSRVAWFDNAHWEYYQLYGRRWQLVPYPVYRDGIPFQLLHVNWRSLTLGSPNSREVVRNLLVSRAQYVFVSQYRLNQWPPQYEVIKHSPDMRQIYNDGYSAIFEIVREPGPDSRFIDKSRSDPSAHLRKGRSDDN